MGIQLLSEEIIARIAAGEVIERPASVVKELIENALDAQAQSIHAEVSSGGRKRIKISDDGRGIKVNEVERAFLRHATSKLQSADDLNYINTLGFRGEALASIAAVSRTTVQTRHRDEDIGTALATEGGQIINQKGVGAPAGTVMTVENLFFNTPARLKFLKSENTEKRHITTIITRYAMAYPAVRFIYEQDGREVFRSSGTGELSDVVMKVMGLEVFKQMIEVSGEEKGRSGYPVIGIRGYVSEPALHRNNRSKIIIFVNGRSVQDAGLTHAVVQAYHTLMMKGRYPYAVLMIDVPPDFVDVNVHPTKAEVRFQDRDLMFVAVQRTIRRAVIDLASPQNIQSNSHREFQTRQSAGWSRSQETSAQLAMDLHLQETGQYPRQYPHNHVKNHDDDLSGISEGAGIPARPRTLPLLRVVGQIGATYIIAEGPAGMYMIDQHAAHERIMFEQFMERYEKQDIIRQTVLESETVTLSAYEATLLEEKQEILQAVGFELEVFGPHTYRIHSIPAILSDNNPIEVILGILQELESDQIPGQQTIEEKIILHVCKRASVKAGQILSVEEMQALIRQLERCQSPHTCPHGRPTMIHMSSEHLAREFGRLGS